MQTGIASCCGDPSQKRACSDITARRVTTHFLAVTGGGLIGVGFGLATRFTLRFLQRFGATSEQQIALTLASGYLSFYVANAPCKVSGGDGCRGKRAGTFTDTRGRAGQPDAQRLLPRLCVICNAESLKFGRRRRMGVEFLWGRVWFRRSQVWCAVPYNECPSRGLQPSPKLQALWSAAFLVLCQPGVSPCTITAAGSGLSGSATSMFGINNEKPTEGQRMIVKLVVLLFPSQA